MRAASTATSGRTTCWISTAGGCTLSSLEKQGGVQSRCTRPQRLPGTTLPIFTVQLPSISLMQRLVLHQDQNTGGGKAEVHIATSKSNYLEVVHYASWFSQQDGPNGF